jgi:hypothetical protein
LTCPASEVTSPPRRRNGFRGELAIELADVAALELADVAALEDRSQHKTAVRALQRGLEILRAEHRG